MRAYGLIPEIIGRLPILTHLDQLSKESLKRILTEPKNAVIKQYQKLMQMDGIELIFNDDVLDYIVDKTLEYRLGARGLRSLVETIMTDLMFELPTKEQDKEKKASTYTVTLAYAKQQIERANSL